MEWNSHVPGNFPSFLDETKTTFFICTLFLRLLCTRLNRLDKADCIAESSLMPGCFPRLSCAQHETKVMSVRHWLVQPSLSSFLQNDVDKGVTFDMDSTLRPDL